MEIKNKVVLITGASKGIGSSTAIILSKEGANIIINYKSDDSLAKKVLEECNKYSDKNMIIKADITNEIEVKEMFDKINKEYGKLDVLVNNAGIFDGSDSTTNLEAFENIFKINLLAQVRATKYALKLMKTGKIINVSSIAGRMGRGSSHSCAYSAMKAALDSYTTTLAKDLAPKILVNSVAPGKTLTPMWGNLDKNKEKELGETQLINRFIHPNEIADGILFLIKNDAICGEILTIDGGMGLRKP
ncbi:MAG TPA: SDR family oxidoreductase [Candidatus Pacearchaeota archaeon]|nr:SDR family oxidoreductase [Candidatus Pacearchaeota archaeon]